MMESEQLNHHQLSIKYTVLQTHLMKGHAEHFQLLNHQSMVILVQSLSLKNQNMITPQILIENTTSIGMP